MDDEQAMAGGVGDSAAPKSRRDAFVIAAAAGLALTTPTRAEETATLSTQTPQRFTVRFAKGAPSSGWLPLTLDAGLHLRINAKINGQLVAAIIDSGAARTVLDRDFARRIGAVLHPGFRLAGVTGDVDGALADGMELAIGAMTVGGVSAAVLDLSELARMAGEPIDVVLGRELFERTLVDLDLSGGRVEFSQPGPTPSGSDRQVLRLTQTPRGSRQIPVSLNGGPLVEAVFDLGNSAPILISPDYANQTKLLEGRRVSTVASVGAEGRSINQVVMLDSLSLGAVTLHDIPAEIPKTWNRPSPVFIGLPVLSRFKLITNYARDQLALSPDLRLIAAPFPKDRSGIGAQRLAEGFGIVHVALGSPAMQAGLQAGDRIVAIDGELIDPDYFKRNPSIGTRPSGTRLALTLSDGRVVTMVLQDYY